MTLPPPVELDVRSVLASGGSPLPMILAKVNELAPGECLRLLVPFEPTPLYRMLAERGWAHIIEPREAEEVAVTFYQRSSEEEPEEILDLRELTPPEPMSRILQRLAGLPPGARLGAWTRFRPVHLLDILEERSWQGSSREAPEGYWETMITRGEDPK